MTLSELNGLLKLWNELPAIVQRADKERLSVLLPEFKRSHPQLWEEIVFCSKMESPPLVLAYLTERFPALVMLRTIPNVESIIQFLMDFVKERMSDASNLHTFTVDARLLSRDSSPTPQTGTASRTQRRRFRP